MKIIAIIILSYLPSTIEATASITDAVAHFKTEQSIASPDKILKIEIDVDGDGKNEVLLGLKSNVDKEKENHEPADWTFYIRENNAVVAFTKSVGTSEKSNELSVDDIPQIDHERCFLGLISELGKSGIMTIRYHNPRNGPSIGIIYAYTIEGDHLKKTELARFSVSNTPHVLFTKYLADGKRTIITPEEVTP